MSASYPSKRLKLQKQHLFRSHEPHTGLSPVPCNSIHDYIRLFPSQSSPPPPPPTTTKDVAIIERPMTGFMRNGYCEVPASDAGNHSIAAEVTDEFLKFSAERGNDLRQIGLKGGCKWCLCVSRWKEAFDARGKEGDKIVPKIFLNATNEKALDKVSLDDLKKFAVDKE
ncbi:hypothetical protein E4T44_05755 [Aureobasidium sp. EXF-8845]|nr:hypothetical protein E4T44_05755 [Aureobasidium sp. EXF-8845]